MLSSKSLTELRGIAQALSVPDVFQKDKAHLIQAIELKQAAAVPVPKPEIPKPQYDARLMTKPPSRKSDPNSLAPLLAPYIERGLQVEYTDEMWKMRFGIKTDQGTLRMPLRIVLKCADELMR